MQTQKKSKKIKLPVMLSSRIIRAHVPGHRSYDANHPATGFRVPAMHTARYDWVSTCGYQLIIAQRVTESACLTKLMFHSNLLIIIEFRGCVGACNAEKWCACSIFFQKKGEWCRSNVICCCKKVRWHMPRWIIIFRSKIG